MGLFKLDPLPGVFVGRFVEAGVLEVDPCLVADWVSGLVLMPTENGVFRVFLIGSDF